MSRRASSLLALLALPAAAAAQPDPAALAGRAQAVLKAHCYRCHGQGGTNALDYAAWTTTVVVDLAHSAASGVHGFVNSNLLNIQKATGSRMCRFGS